MSDSELDWIKSSYSIGSGACVELTRDRGMILVRSSRRPDVEITYTSDEIAAFLKAAKAGEFDYLISP